MKATTKFLTTSTMAPLITFPIFEEEHPAEEYMNLDITLSKLNLEERQQSFQLHDHQNSALHVIKETTRQRRVRFNLGTNVTKVINPGIEYYTDEDIHDKWVNGQDLYNIKVDAKKLSGALRRISKERGTACLVSIAHRKTTLMMRSDFKSLVKLSPSSPDEDLAVWCCCNDGRRGLERFVSSDYNVIRSSDVHNTRKIVLDEQERQRDYCVRLDDETLGKVAREGSRRARTFARLMGVADSLSSKCNEQYCEHTNMKNNPYVVKRRVAPSRTQSEMMPQQLQAFPQYNNTMFSHCQTENNNGNMMQQLNTSCQCIYEAPTSRQAPPRKKSKLNSF